MNKTAKLLGTFASIFFGLAISAAHAGVVFESEPNDACNLALDSNLLEDFQQAQDIDGFFSTGANPDVENSDIDWPWVSVGASGGSGDACSNPDSLDFYSFVVHGPGPGETFVPVQGIFDIDYGHNSGGSFDSQMLLFDAAGNFLVQNDDDGNDSGSVSNLDARLTYEFDQPGTYIVLVGEVRTQWATFLNRFFDKTGIDEGNTYELQVSLSAHPTGGGAPDSDGDGVTDRDDNCPTVPNPGQEDTDGDGIGDACDEPVDSDEDGVPDVDDNCPDTFNPDQADSDFDGIGDACDDFNNLDQDEDGVEDDADNCPAHPNPDQADLDGDGAGDACDSDVDGDGIDNTDDNCPVTANADQADLDGDGIGDACDDDVDGDGVSNAVDECQAPVTETIVIDHCDTGVANHVMENGCSVADELQSCADNASNHGKYVSCVSHYAKGLKRDGLIYGSEKGAIVSCAAQSHIGKSFNDGNKKDQLAKLSKLSKEVRAKLAALTPEQRAKLAALTPKQLEKLRSLTREQLDKLRSLNEKQLEKLRNLTDKQREQLAKLAEKKAKKGKS